VESQTNGQVLEERGREELEGRVNEERENKMEELYRQIQQ